MAVYGLKDRIEHNMKVWKNYWREFTVEKFAVGLVIIAVLIFGFGYFNKYPNLDKRLNLIMNLIEDFYANSSSELISIAITVLVVDRLNAYRQGRQDLIRLVALFDSNENVITKLAIAELRARKWLYDGSLKNILVQGGNYQEARFKHANLEKTKFYNSEFPRVDFTWANLACSVFQDCNLERTWIYWANLYQADLRGANLKSTRLEGANMFSVKCDSRTILPDGSNWAPDTDWSRWGAVEVDISNWNEWREYVVQNR